MSRRTCIDCGHTPFQHNGDRNDTMDTWEHCRCCADSGGLFPANQPLSAPSEDAPQPDIIDRLRSLPGWWKFKEIADTAAQEIATLRAALARVEQERDEARQRVEIACDALDAYAKDVVAAVEKAARAAVLTPDEAVAYVHILGQERDAAQAQIAALTARAERAEERERAAFFAGVKHERHIVRSLKPGRPFMTSAEGFAAYLAQRSAADAPSDPTPGTQDGGAQ